MKKNYFWGVFLILAGAYLVVSQMGYLPSVGTFTLVFTILCLAAIVYSVLHISFGGILFPLAFIGIMYDEPLGITPITPWTILLAALLGTIGLNLLFANRRKSWKKIKGIKKERNEWKQAEKNAKEEDGEKLYFHSVFGGIIRYVTSTNFQQAVVDSKFSGMKLYFDNAQIPSGRAVITMNATFSGVELYVPKQWKVVNQLNSPFSGVTEKNKHAEDVTAELILEGENPFSGVTIYYV